jgi:hypothetical protein
LGEGIKKNTEIIFNFSLLEAEVKKNLPRSKNPLMQVGFCTLKSFCMFSFSREMPAMLLSLTKKLSILKISSTRL